MKKTTKKGAPKVSQKKASKDLEVRTGKGGKVRGGMDYGPVTWTYTKQKPA